MDILLFIIYCIIVTSTPGPTNLIILSTVHNFGVKKGVEFAFGAWVAFIILLASSVTLNSIFAAALPKIILTMQLIGSGYILYLAYKIYKMDSSTCSTATYMSFRSGFLMQFINPKVIIFTMTVIPNFVMPYYTSYSTLLVFAVIIIMICFMALSTWILFGTLLKSFFQKHQKPANIVMSIFLVYSAISISGITNFIMR